MKPQLILADSNYLLKEGLKSILLDKFHICAEVNSGDLLFQQVLAHKPDLVIINFTASQFSPDDIRLISAAHPDSKILAITSLPDKKTVKDAIASGVLSYLVIDCDKDEIFEAIQSTLAGEAFFCGKIVSEILDDSKTADNSDSSSSSLTCNGIKISARESEIIALIAEGMTNKQIAETLFLSTHTVITHRKNIMNKLGLNNTASLVLFAIKQNLISPNKFLFSN